MFDVAASITQYGFIMIISIILLGIILIDNTSKG